MKRIALLSMVILFVALSACWKTVSPSATFELMIKDSDIAELRRISERFAQMEGFSVQDLVKDDGESGVRYLRPVIFLELERGGEMLVTIQNVLKGGRFLVTYYNPDGEPQPDEVIWNRLLLALDARWPGRRIPYEEHRKQSSG